MESRFKIGQAIDFDDKNGNAGMMLIKCIEFDGQFIYNGWFNGEDFFVWENDVIGKHNGDNHKAILAFRNTLSDYGISETKIGELEIEFFKNFSK